MISDLADGSLQPPERITVSEAAVKYVRLNNPGSYSGPYDLELTPYMREPMDMLNSREKQGVIFVGPSQSSKTAALVVNWIAFTAKCDPMDLIVYEKSQNAAKDFSLRRVDRMHRDSPDIRSELLNWGKSGDNVFDKKYKSGMLLSLSYPAINEMSGRPVPRVALTDYDRMVDDVDGEGAPFDVARARIRTFRSAGKIMAESSPSRDLADPHWKAKGRHEGPPVGGIVGLYNRGDRQRWYWPCPRCNEFFEGHFGLLTWSASQDIMEASQSAVMICPKCYFEIGFEHRRQMNTDGRWLGPGQRVEHGDVVGLPNPSDIASYWLKGTAAAFSTWQQLVRKQIEAENDYQRTGDQLALKTTANTDQAEVWTPRGTETITTPEELQEQAIDLPKREVPVSVRCLFGQVDVQGGHWVCQVFGIQPSDSGVKFDIVFIDRFKIDRSKRVDENGDKTDTRPAAHPEDWDLITEQLLEKTYPVEGTSAKMTIKHAVCDSGGKKGVTSNAYAYWLRLRKLGKHHRLTLVKGDPNPEHPRVHIEMPDSQRKDRLAQARGEIPIMFINSNVMKDEAKAMLERKESGGRIYTPTWFEDYFYQELTVEVRDAKGRWVNPQKKRNEAWDLLYYGLAQCLQFKIGSIDWAAPPPWADVWQKNPLVIKELTVGNKVAKEEETGQSLAALGSLLG